MSRPVLILLLLLHGLGTFAQDDRIDSLRNDFQRAADGPVRFKAASAVYFYYQERNRDSALVYTNHQLEIAIRKKNTMAEGVALVNRSYQLMNQGRYAESLGCLQRAFIFAEDKDTEKEENWMYFLTPYHGNNRLLLLSYTHHMYALLMAQTENLEQQILHFKIAGEIGRQINYTPRIQLAYLNLGQSYMDAKNLDSALYFEKEAEAVAKNATASTFALAKTYLGTIELTLGDIYKRRGDTALSLTYYFRSLQTSTENSNLAGLSAGSVYVSRVITSDIGLKDSALFYALKNRAVLQNLGMVMGPETNLGTSYENIYLTYKMRAEFDSAYKYQGLALVTKDSLARLKIRNLADFQQLTYSEQLRLQNLEKERAQFRNKVRTYILLGGIGVLLLLAIVFYRSNRQKHKAAIEIRQAYENLKSTQQQLIHAEKMASLGELTAGIAHEIQNPLNFVNNFSDINTELLDELGKEASLGNLDEVKNLAVDVCENEKKINFHGSRAADIVKGMLQHSRSNSGTREMADINKLAGEYARLAYHGTRASDNTFNVNLETDFDANMYRQ